MISRNKKVVVEVRADGQDTSYDTIRGTLLSAYHGHRDEQVELKGTAGNEYVIPAHRISFVHTEA
jgi:hypothetical protein